MNLDVQRVPSDGYWSKYWLKAPIHFGNINPRPTPDILFSLLYKSAAPWNETQYKSQKFDKIVIEARGTLDRKSATKYIGRCSAWSQRRWHHDSGLHGGVEAPRRRSGACVLAPSAARGAMHSPSVSGSTRETQRRPPRGRQLPCGSCPP